MNKDDVSHRLKTVRTVYFAGQILKYCLADVLHGFRS